MSSGRPVLVLYNPRSGGGLGKRRAEEIARALEGRHRRASLRETRPDRGVLEDATRETFAALVVVGGDGTIHAAVQELADRELPVAFCGTGTVNVLARERRLPSDAQGVAELVTAGRTATIPLLLGNGRRFLLFAEAGWLAGAVRDVNAWRARTGRHGKLEFARYGARRLCASWGRPLRVRMRLADGSERSGRFANVLATRARVYGGTLTLPLLGVGREPLEDERFTVFAQRMRTPVGNALYLAAGAGRGMALLTGGFVERHLARELWVEGPPTVGVHLDAESEGSAFRLPLHVAPAGQALRLFVP